MCVVGSGSCIGRAGVCGVVTQTLALFRFRVNPPETRAVAGFPPKNPPPVIPKYSSEVGTAHFGPDFRPQNAPFLVRKIPRQGGGAGGVSRPGRSHGPLDPKRSKAAHIAAFGLDVCGLRRRSGAGALPPSPRSRRGAGVQGGAPRLLHPADRLGSLLPRQGRCAPPTAVGCAAP